MSILKTLKRHLKKEKVSFHMPGHKSGSALKGTELKSHIWKYDTTELSDTDCLINPTGVIKKAEEKAAKIYGAKHSFFLVNGASCGILAMFYASFKEGDKVIVCRDCHKSVINALVLSGVVPVYADVIVHEKGFSCGADPEIIAQKLRENKDVKGVFITSPTYFGIVSDIRKIARLAHEEGAILLCDESHGAHFPFSDKFPESAVSCGADISVVSLHKSMPSPNQTAVLNLGDCRVSEKDIKNAINMFQTTSPSYVFLGAMEKALDLSKARTKKLTEKVLLYKTKSKFLCSFDDPFKLILDFYQRGYTGHEVSSILESKFGIYAELATSRCVLLMISWGNTKKDFDLLSKAIDYIESLPKKSEARIKHEIATSGKCLKTPKEVFYSEKEKVLLEEAIGRTAACEVIIFPPCIPVFFPGEEINKEHVDIIKNAKEEDLVITGLDDNFIYVTK